MKIKKQFAILTTLIISIPILCSAFILIHTYMHSPNRYLMQGSANLNTNTFSLLSDKEKNKLENSLKMLPQEVEALLYRLSDRKILYSTIPEIKTGSYIPREEIWHFISETNDEYFYQFSRKSYSSEQTVLLTRLAIQNINTEQKTRYFLRILLIIILMTIFCLINIFFISKAIFEGLGKIEHSSSQMAEGKLDKSISTQTSPSRTNEFTVIMNSLEKMRIELLESQASKNRFITGISHDLRTPVAVIKGYSEAIKDDVISDSKEIKKTMELIDQKTSQLEGMIDTLLNFIKLNNTEIKEKLVRNSITKLINDFSKYAEITGKVFKRNVSSNISITKDIKVPLNAQLVYRSFENLFSNAIRYTKDGDKIELIAYEDPDDKHSLIFKIKDSGYGIDKKDLDYIFDLFYRGTNSRQEEGMGVGLAVVKNIMYTHGWKIFVESEKDKGTCFTIVIPH